MKIVQYQHAGGRAVGYLVGQDIAPLSQFGASFALEVRDLLAADSSVFQRVQRKAAKAASVDLIRLDDVKIIPPITGAGKIICLGLNYAEHAAETNWTRPSYPVVFLRANSSLIAHGDPIIRPRQSTALDFEGELVAVISKTARRVSRHNALEYVAGYSIFNDATIRDYQMRTPQWTVGKNFDGTGAFGPVIVTSDELPPGASGLSIETRLNSKVMQQDNTRQMIFDVPETIEILSECMTLEPGDLIVTGTPGGIGAARDPRVWMQPGDVVEVTIEGLGTLKNPIVAEQLL
jgi:acylpyruvate hydrolase